MNRFWFVACLLGVLGNAIAQTPPAEPAKPSQDPAAVKMIERFDALRHVPRAEGLKDLQFTVRMPVTKDAGLDLVVRWKAPDKIAAELAVPADTPEGLKRQLTILTTQKRAEAKTMAGPMVAMQIGELSSEKVKDDDVALAAPNQVKITARSAASKAQFKEQLLTFDDRGLVKIAELTAPTGAVTKSEGTFTEWNKKFVYQSLVTTLGKAVNSVTFEYANVGDFMLVKKATNSSKGLGAEQQQVIEFRDVKANSGLDDKLFEEKPAEPK